MLRFLCRTASRDSNKYDNIRIYNLINSLTHDKSTTNHIIVRIKEFTEWKLRITTSRYVQTRLPYLTEPISSTSYESYNSDTQIVMFLQGDSLSETIIQRYKGPPQPIQGYIPVLTIIFPTTRVENTFDVEEN